MPRNHNTSRCSSTRAGRSGLSGETGLLILRRQYMSSPLLDTTRMAVLAKSSPGSPYQPTMSLKSASRSATVYEVDVVQNAAVQPLPYQVGHRLHARSAGSETAEGQPARVKSRFPAEAHRIRRQRRTVSAQAQQHAEAAFEHRAHVGLSHACPRKGLVAHDVAVGRGARDTSGSEASGCESATLPSISLWPVLGGSLARGVWCKLCDSKVLLDALSHI
eukprot:scaffold11091_cov75-Phaeocystis_antarctica.AAC.5